MTPDWKSDWCNKTYQILNDCAGCKFLAVTESHGGSNPWCFACRRNANIQDGWVKATPEQIAKRVAHQEGDEHAGEPQGKKQWKKP